VNLPAENSLLVVNAGSSSLKFAVFQARAADFDRLVSGSIDRIGQPRSTLSIEPGANSPAIRRRIATGSPAKCVRPILAALDKISSVPVTAVGHRVVHGGPRFTSPQRITPNLLQALCSLSPFDPEHLPGEIDLIRELQRWLPGTPQVACFDTAFHHDLPHIAQLLPIPRRYAAGGMRRYGFHGLSYEFLLEELGRLGETAATKGRVILAHLGSGASLAAVRDGRCLDTSMGFTPTSGLVMGTRSGDMDPGAMAYLAKTEKLTSAQLNRLLNRDSGLRGISGTTSDMRQLLGRESIDPRAAEAIGLFCYQAKKWIGSFAAVLGGLDALVFSGGIGENCPSVRGRICDGLEFLGVELDPAANARNSATLSTPASRVAVRMIHTDEELMIARHVRETIFTEARCEPRSEKSGRLFQTIFP
jgi:acetate kinase